MKTTRTILLLSLWAAVGCAESAPPPAAVEVVAEHQLETVDAKGLFEILKTYRGKALLVNIWSST